MNQMKNKKSKRPISDLKDLYAAKSDAQKVLNGISNEIQDIEENQLIPKLRKEYEGKYFKYRNNYSNPQKPSDYWFVYTKCITVIDAKFFFVSRFETDKDGQIEIKHERTGSHLFQNRITKREYDAARRKITAKITRMLK